MPWRERFIDYLQKERADLERRLAIVQAGRCQMWESADGDRKDVTDEYAAGLRSRIAEIEQIMVEEGLS